MPLKDVTLPGRAGTLQREGDIGGLVAELGDNYDTYHEFLAGELRRHIIDGKTPRPGDYRDDLTGYITVWERLQRLVMAEQFVRQCYRNRKEGKPLHEGPDPALPLIDAEIRLVSLTDPPPSEERFQPSPEPSSASAPVPLPRQVSPQDVARVRPPTPSRDVLGDTQP